MVEQLLSAAVDQPVGIAAVVLLSASLGVPLHAAHSTSLPVTCRSSKAMHVQHSSVQSALLQAAANKQQPNCGPAGQNRTEAAPSSACARPASGVAAADFVDTYSTPVARAPVGGWGGAELLRDLPSPTRAMFWHHDTSITPAFGI
jgi:hypothetical protein